MMCSQLLYAVLLYRNNKIMLWVELNYCLTEEERDIGRQDGFVDDYESLAK